MDEEGHVNPAVEAAVKRARDRFRLIDPRTNPGQFDVVRRDLLREIAEIHS